MTCVARRLVSKQKQRLKQDGFDLDLTYITDQVIAMGLPCTGVSAIWRNPQSEVIRFLNTYHENNFKIYNLCTRPQDQYDPEKFGLSVASFPFEDHGVPPLEMVDALARSVQSWLGASPERVVCIHCLAGKGRTGLMLCAALLLMGVFDNARDAMAYYGEKRMKNKKGVTQASQRRWVEYYQQMLEKRAVGEPLDLGVPQLLTRVVVHNFPPKLQLSLQIEANGQQLYDSGPFQDSLELRMGPHSRRSPLCKGDFGRTRHMNLRRTAAPPHRHLAAPPHRRLAPPRPAPPPCCHVACSTWPPRAQLRTRLCQACRVPTPPHAWPVRRPNPQ